MTRTILQPGAGYSGLRRGGRHFFRIPSRPAIGALAAVIFLLSLLSGCVHRIDIQQGNFLDQEDIDRVAVGMTRIQVRALLGTPMVADPFHEERWDYVYYLRQGRLRKPEYRHFIVRFDGTDKVTSIEHPAKGRTAGKPEDTGKAVDGDRNARNENPRQARQSI